MTRSSDIEPLGVAIAAFIPALTQQPERHPVHRTSSTHQRKPISRADRIYVYARDGFRCVWCGRGRPLQIDHFITWSALGSDHVNNLRTLCQPCNNQRSNFRTPDDEAWRPLPVTKACVHCYPDLETDCPSVGPAFCYWCRVATVGYRETQ